MDFFKSIMKENKNIKEAVMKFVFKIIETEIDTYNE